MLNVFPNILDSEYSSFKWMKATDNTLGGTLQIRNSYSNKYMDILKYQKHDNYYYIIHSQQLQTGLSILFAEMHEIKFKNEEVLKTYVETTLISFANLIINKLKK